MSQECAGLALLWEQASSAQPIALVADASQGAVFQRASSPLR